MFLCHPFPLRAESMGEGLCYVMPWWEGEVEVLRWPQLMAPVYLLLALPAFVAFFCVGVTWGTLVGFGQNPAVLPWLTDVRRLTGFDNECL